MVYTGKDSPKMTAKYIMYDGKVSQTGWGSPYAQMINGTEALLFHPGVKRSDVLEVYVDELFRSGYFTHYQDVNEFGIDMYQFRLPAEELSNKTQDKGFHMNGPSGVLNLTAVFPLSKNRETEGEGGKEEGEEIRKREGLRIGKEHEKEY